MRQVTKEEIPFMRKPFPTGLQEVRDVGNIRDGSGKSAQSV
jgi:hypothetical protein